MVKADASVIKLANHEGIGGIIRESTGLVMGAFAKQINGCYDLFLAESMAIRAGLQFSIDTAASKWLRLNATSLKTVVAINDKVGRAVEGIVPDNNGGVTCHFVPRDCYRVAHAS